ncbi:MAG: sulfurtransferase [Phycisphaera sp.]|nr:MAG: sulfurtransferase [Phycisphaera sp.]
MSDAPIDQNTGLPEDYGFREEDEITPRETKRRLDASDGLVVIDCREDDELQTSKLDQAVHIPLGRLVNEVDDVADDLPSGKDTPTVILCRTGRRSLMAALALRRMGFTDIKSVAGGIDLWARDIDTTLKRY